MTGLEYTLALARTYMALAVESNEIHYARKSKQLFKQALQMMCEKDVV